MTIEIRTGIKYEYKCDTCDISYIEQRYPHEPQFFINCQNFNCSGLYTLVSETEFNFEQEVPEPEIIDVEEVTPTPALEG